MKLRAVFVLPLLFLAWSAVPAEAWFPHGSGVAPPAGPCVHSGAGYADGCAAAPTNALFQLTNWFGASGTLGAAQQSGQAAITSRPPWDVACVDYVCGPTSLDASLIDAKVSPPTGCTYDGDVVINCNTNNSTVDVSGRKFIGVGLWMNGTGQTLTGSNFHVQENAADCRRHNGSGQWRGGSATVTLSNFLADFDGSYVPYSGQTAANATCANNADQYKTVGDPGFTDQSTGSATLSGYSLTYTGTPSGSVAVGQYIAVNGSVPFRARILSGSGLNWTLENVTNGGFNGISISGTTMTYTTKSGTPVVGDNIIGTGVTAGTLLVADLGSNQWQVSISQTVTGPVNVTAWKQWNQPTPVTVTTGPVEENGSAFIANSSGQHTFTYGAILDWGTAFGNSGGNNISIKYNYAVLGGRGSHPNTTDGNHNQFEAWIPGPGSATFNITSVQDFNAIQISPWSDDGTFTGVIDQFSTCTGSCVPIANGVPGYEVQFDKVEFANNTVVSNSAKNNPGAVMSPGIFRTLSQGPSPAVGNVNWSLAQPSHIVTINSVNSGSVSTTNTILCNGFPPCSQAVKLTSQIDATHFNSSNTVDTKTGLNNNVATWPGEFTLYQGTDNYVDVTGSGGVWFDDTAGILVTTKTRTGNIDMLTGGSAN